MARVSKQSATGTPDTTDRPKRLIVREYSYLQRSDAEFERVIARPLDRLS